MQLEKIFLKIGIPSTYAELVTLLLVILSITVIFWLIVGRFRLHNVLINIFISFSLVQAIPKEFIGSRTTLSVMLFLILVVAFTLIGKYTFDIHLSGSGLAYWQIFIMSFLEVGLILSISATFLGDKFFAGYISKEALFYFTSPWAKFIWLSAPLAFLVYINKRDK